MVLLYMMNMVMPLDHQRKLLRKELHKLFSPESLWQHLEWVSLYSFVFERLIAIHKYGDTFEFNYCS